VQLDSSECVLHFIMVFIIVRARITLGYMTLYKTLIFSCIVWTLWRRIQHVSAHKQRCVLQNRYSVVRHINVALELIGPAK
jgi:hypothetical protein